MFQCTSSTEFSTCLPDMKHWLNPFLSWAMALCSNACTASFLSLYQRLRQGRLQFGCNVAELCLHRIQHTYPYLVWYLRGLGQCESIVLEKR